MRNYPYRLMLALVLMLALALTVAAQDGDGEGEGDFGDGETRTAAANIQTAEGEEAGRVAITSWNDKLLFTADLRNLPAGFHGFHIHTTGSCEDTGDGPFTAAGGHLNPDGTSHPEHAGDLPPLLVTEDGTAYLSVATDRVTFENLFDEDGSAFIVHSNADNFANIPERYGGPDEETLNAGDSGERIACGVIQQDVTEMMGEGTEAESTPAG